MRPTYLIAAAAGLALSASAVSGAPVLPQADVVDGTSVIQVHNNCHSSYQTHGGNFPEHYHAGGNCAMVTTGGGNGIGGGGDCHANVQNHWVPGYGTIYHSHVGNCQVQPYTAAPSPTPGYGGCISVGGVLTVCPPVP